MLTPDQAHELRSHQQFFRAYYGECWQLKLSQRAGLPLHWVCEVLSGHNEWKPKHAAKLRSLRRRLQSVAASFLG